MFCRACGKEVLAGDLFCSFCGARISDDPLHNSASWHAWSRPSRSNWFDRSIASMNGFWRRVTEGLELQDLWSHFRAEARSSYELYSKDVVWERGKDESRWKRDARIARTFFWAILMKLTPSRRVLLLIALALFVLSLLNERPVEWLLTVIAVMLLLVLELADRVIMKRDLEIAREIQSWLVPKSPPAVAGVDIAFATRPANTVAGDYYDAFLRQVMNGAGPVTESSMPNRLAVVVADVAGKSVPAALLMATFQASLRTLAAAPVPLLDLVRRLNQYACAHSLGGLRYTTAFFAELDIASRTLAYVNAGHNYPLVFRAAGGGPERLETGGLPLGIRENADYQSALLSLHPGDELVVFTDGLVEAINEDEEEFGETRLLDLLHAIRYGSASEQLGRMMAGVDAFVGGARQHDDITCLLLRVG